MEAQAGYDSTAGFNEQDNKYLRLMTGHIVGLRACRTGSFHLWRLELEGGGQAPAFCVARCRTRSSSWVPLGRVRARRGPVWVHIFVVHRYGSIESSVRAPRVPSGHIRAHCILMWVAYLLGWLVNKSMHYTCVRFICAGEN